jgi:hypothetical protein
MGRKALFGLLCGIALSLVAPMPRALAGDGAKAWKGCYEIYKRANKVAQPLRDDDWKAIRDFDVSAEEVAILDRLKAIRAEGQRCEKKVGAKYQPPSKTSPVGRALNGQRKELDEWIDTGTRLIAEAREVYEPIQGMSAEQRKAYLAMADEHFPKYGSDFAALSNLFARLKPHLRYEGGWQERYVEFPGSIPIAVALTQGTSFLRKQAEPVVRLHRFTAYDKHDRHTGRLSGRVAKLVDLLDRAEERLEVYNREQFKGTREGCKDKIDGKLEALSSAIAKAEAENDLKGLRVREHTRHVLRHPSDLSRGFAFADFCVDVMAAMGDDTTAHEKKIAELRQRASAAHEKVNKRLIAKAEPPEDVFQGRGGKRARALIAKEIRDDPRFPKGGKIKRVYLRRAKWNRKAGTRWDKIGKRFERYDQSYMFAQVAVAIDNRVTEIYNVDILKDHLSKKTLATIRSKQYSMLTKNL